MAGIKVPHTKLPVSTVASAVLGVVNKQLPNPSALNQLKYATLVADRGKLLFSLLLESGSVKAKLATEFFKDLPSRLESVMKNYKLRLLVADFGFSSMKEFADYLKDKLSSVSVSDLQRFMRGSEGRKWWFIGTFLWERYVKYGPPRRYLDNLAAGICDNINTEIRNNKSYKVTNAWGTVITINSEFGYIYQGKPGKLAVGVEFLLDIDKSHPESYLDMGHIAFNKEGYWIIPTPIEIKQPTASKKVAKQFSKFIERFKSAKKLIVVFEESDLEILKKQPGFDKVKWTIVDKKIIAELDREKLVFGPRGLKQTLVKPVEDTWGAVTLPSDPYPDIRLGVAETAKGVGFNFLVVEVDVNRDPFVKLFEAVLLGTKAGK